MKIINLDKHVIMVKDIVTKEESNFLINIAKSASYEEWDAYRKSLGEKAEITKFAYGDWKKQILWLQGTSKLFEETQFLLDSINTKCISVINNYYEKDYVLYPLYNIFKFKEGDFMKEHHDSGLSLDIKLGMVVYLNENYDGGEIYYPKVNLQVKPIARSLVVHPANIIYRHGVKPVSNGERFSLAGFVRKNYSQ